MGGNQKSASVLFGKLGNQIQQFTHSLRVNTKSRFIHNNNGRIFNQNIRNAQSLAHTTGIGTYFLVTGFGKSGPFQQTVDRFFGYLFFLLIQYQVSIASKQQELQSLQDQLTAQETTNAELSSTLDQGDSAIIERYAREQGYVRPNERVFVDISGK